MKVVVNTTGNGQTIVESEAVEGKGVGLKGASVTGKIYGVKKPL